MKNNTYRLFQFCGLALAISCLPVMAADHATGKMPFVAALFTDNMVLQRNLDIPFWGWTTPGQQVTVSLNGKTAHAIADPNGKWIARLGTFSAGGPYTVTIAGAETVTLTNVLIGDVWICAGQSNMEFKFGRLGQVESANPQLRLFVTRCNVTVTPQLTTQGKWGVCSPENINKFSAVGYYFGRKLQNDEKVPVGLLETTFGGTPAEAWTSIEALGAIPHFKAAVDNRISERAVRDIDAWTARQDLASPTAKALIDPQFDISNWKTIPVPSQWNDSNIGRLMVGTAWFRKDIDLPATWAGKGAELHVGVVYDVDDTFVNGTRVGGLNAFDGWDTQRVYPVPVNLLKVGKNTILVRVANIAWYAGICGKPEDLKLVVPGDSSITPISLAGDWKYGAVDRCPGDAGPAAVSTIYNGMVAPLIPYGIKGVVWYQGEANAWPPTATLYRTLLPTMVQDWRRRFNCGDFPFLIVQLPGFGDTHDQPADTSWAILRESQAITAQTLPHSGLAVTIDIGEAKNLHPKNKLDVGERLALVAEATVYGRNVESSGPVFHSATVEGRAIRLNFDHVGEGLMTKGDALKGFAIAGVDGKFVWADAVIDGKTIIVSSPKVEAPVNVRYAWDDFPICNLFNKNGLPAMPFRTDVPATLP